MEYVFGVSDQGLRSMANSYLTDASNFPSPVPDGSITVLDGANITFSSSKPLKGRGIVVIRGQVTINPGSAAPVRA